MKKVKEVGIAEDSIVGTLHNGEKFYSKIISLSSNEYFMSKIYTNKITFYFVDKYYSIDNRYREIVTESELAFKVRIKTLENRLNQTPFEIIKEESKKIKITILNYLFLVLIISNILGMALYFLINKDLFFKFLKYIIKSS